MNYVYNQYVMEINFAVNIYSWGSSEGLKFGLGSNY